MESSLLCDSLLKWLETFPGREGTELLHLTDGVVMAQVLHQIAPEYFTDLWLAKIKSDVGDNWRLKVSNLRKVQQGIVDYYQEQLNQNIKHFPLPDLNKIGEHGDQLEMGRMLQLILGCAVNCENKQQYIEAIMNMEERVQKVIMEAIQELMLREGSPGPLGEGRGGAGGVAGGLGGDLGPASFHPHIKQVLEQLEAATQTRDEMVQRCHELEQQISVMGEEKRVLATENEKLVGRLDAWELGGGELAGSSSTLRYRDLKKQIDSLQDELFKLETSRDEYRSRAEDLERANQEVMQRNEDLQALADEARGLKDEVDALREMSERAVVYEGTMETYKKKLEELSDLRRQVRILEEKNSDYMQHNMELEEEVKKSGTWRPQLELYKKQVGELHQRLAEEAKNTDRQAFENKKILEKMEALTQEKDRLAKERDALKETMEELRCHISALTSPDTTASSRPPSDLSDVDLLDVVPHEVRERLIRLQHENSMLKQRAAEGSGSSEQVPMLQTMVSDLQERQASLTHENRWEVNVEVSGGKRKGSASPPILPSGFPLYGELGRKYSGSVSPPAFLDSHLSPDMSRKLRIFRKNLKWASESDLLVLRQPKGLLSTNFLTSTLPSLQPRSLPPALPAVTSSLATQTTKEAPIVIRHIHEFKMSPSPTNEDSGCCRTSPSSCEEAGEGPTSDFPTGTLDSGISGMYSGTLESGISAPYRCLSPVIPSIVEECTTHHVTDIIPALAGHGVSSPTIMHHSHPAHTSCTHCCSDNMEGSGRESGRAGCASPLPPPPRPHSVCSYNPPYRYASHMSPTSTGQSKHPISSSTTTTPPQSPFTLTQTSPITTLCLPATIIDLSLVHTQSVGSSLTRLTEDYTAQATVSPISSVGQTSGNGVLVSPQGRRASSGYSRPSLLPESPTPHNSPRLPNSIYATRTRSGKSLSSTALNETVTKDRPVTQALLVARSPNPEKCTKSQPEARKNNTEMPSIKPEVNGHVVDPPNTAVPRIKETPSLLLTKAAPLKQEKDVKAGDTRKPEVGKSALTSLPPLPQRPKEGDGSKPERISSGSSISPKEKNQSKISMPVKAEINGTNKETNGAGKSREGNTSTAQTPSTTEHRLPSYPGVRYTAGKNAGDAATKSPSGNNSPALSMTRKSGEKKCPSPKTGGSLLSRERGGSRRGSGSLSRSGNHVKFRDPVVSQVSQSGGGDTPPVHYSPASPRERMSPPPHNAPQAKSLQPSDSPRTQRPAPEVTMLSNTLFTRFEVAPVKSDAPRRPRTAMILPSATDTDTDLETLERKLTLGMYAAPLVSSESCTSVSPDDWEGDPSATDYCTDNGSDTEYDPAKFKPYGHLDRIGVAQAVPLGAMDKAKREKPEATTAAKSSKMADNVANLARTYSFFRHASKAKKQRKMVAKEPIPLPPLTAHGGVVKTKNKTAKVMVAETFNAMFMLCTP